MALFDIFSQFGKKEEKVDYQAELKSQESIAPVREEDSVIVNSGGILSQSISYSDTEAIDEKQLINTWREMAERPEIDWAVQEIVNEAIVTDFTDYPVSLTIPEDQKLLPEAIGKKLQDEFDIILSLLNFNRTSTEKFRQWYIDGKHYYHGIINPKSPGQGLIGIRWIDPRSIKKVIETEKAKNAKGIEIEKVKDTYYLYSEYSNNRKSYTGSTQKSSQVIKVHPEAIAYSNSGLFKEKNDGSSIAVSHLNKAVKPANQLNMLEDSLVIYRLSRAPERRIFYVDVGNLPKTKAEQYLSGIMNRFKTKMVYDSKTGEVKTAGNNLSMLEDYWLPRREGGRGTEVTTLQGGQNLGELSDVDYFYKKLYKSLNIPSTRMDSDGSFNMGRSAEITREEVKFSKFIAYLRSKFSETFIQLLKIQVITKNIMKVEDFDKISSQLTFKWQTDSYWDELMFNEMWQTRVNLLNQMEAYTGEYFSKEWIKKNVLSLSVKDIEEITKQIEDETPDEPEMPEPGMDGEDDGEEDAADGSKTVNIKVSAAK